MDMEKPSEPDSTTLEKDVRQEFHIDDDVLYLKKDGLRYLGTVVQVDSIYKKCLVEFDDNTKTWCCFKDLKLFGVEDNKSCYTCKKSQSENDNKILVCSKCDRACHQLCDELRILNTTANWMCGICREEKSASKKLSPSKKVAGSDSPSKKVVSSNTSPTSLNKLPYNLKLLKWDSKHQVNEEGRYCYCGKNGDWSDNMLQCKRCRQWFHVKCSTSVSYPILRGDKSFEFTCSVCNGGKEKYKRLEMEWPDLVTLIFHNLKLKEKTKDYNIENIILTFVKKHWDYFKLPPQITNKYDFFSQISKTSLEDTLFKYLYKKECALSEAECKPLQNGDINSSEIGCRVTEPQKSEHKTVPPCVIKQINKFPKVYSTTLGDRDRKVTGKLNTSHTTDFKVISSSEYLGRGLVKRSTPFPDQSNKRDERFRSHAVRKASRLLNKNMKWKQKTDETSVLESNVPIGQSADEDDEDEDDEDDDDEEDDDEDEDTSKYSESEDFLDEGKRKMSLRTRVSNPEVRKRPQRNLLEARLNSTESKLYNAFTPVDISKTKKNRSVGPPEPIKRPEPVTKKPKPLKPKIEKTKIVKPKLVQKTIIDSFNIKSGKGVKELIPLVRKYKVKDDQSSGDSKSNSNSVKSDKNRKRRHSIGSEIPIESDGDTSDDEASSRGTSLDPFIPSTKDFEGQNNPFRTVSDLINTAAGVTPSTLPPITLPLPLKTVIPHTDPPRLKKRQLSEEDIIIDRNGQVKRRRRQRKNRMIERALASASGTASKTAQFVPVKNNCVDYALNKRQLRARESMKLTEKPIPLSAKTTPVKQSPTKDSSSSSNPVAEDLESSVKYFFGPAGRIANGEKYQVVAKRFTPDGRLQCVVEWKGVPT